MRWSTSGRLTPAASTLKRISPSPGTGRGRSTVSSTSGPPGREATTACIVSTGLLTRGLRSIAAILLTVDCCDLVDRAPRFVNRDKFGGRYAICGGRCERTRGRFARPLRYRTSRGRVWHFGGERDHVGSRTFRHK